MKKHFLMFNLDPSPKQIFFFKKSFLTKFLTLSVINELNSSDSEIGNRVVVIVFSITITLIVCNCN